MSSIKDVIDRIDPAYGKFISVGKGWEQIVIDCNSEIAAIDPDYRLFQVKEKYGQLRFYCEPSDGNKKELKKVILDIVEKYEEIAARTCEESGLNGVLMRSIGGWYKTLNPDYASSKYSYAGYTQVDY